MDIIVLCGGLSMERDVSLKSGAMIARALRENGHRAVLVDSFFGYTGSYLDPKEIFERPVDDLRRAIELGRSCGVDVGEIEKMLRTLSEEDI